MRARKHASLAHLVGAGVDARLGDDVHAEGGEGVAEVLLHVVGELLGVGGDGRAVVLHVVDGDAEAL